MRDFGGFLRGIFLEKKKFLEEKFLEEKILGGKNSWKRKKKNLVEKLRIFWRKKRNFTEETPQKLRIPGKNSGKKMEEFVKFLELKNSVEKRRIPRKKRKKIPEKMPRN